MKVLFFDFNLPYFLANNSYPVGGATVQLYAWLHGFIANNVKVGLLTFKGAKDIIGSETNIELYETYHINRGRKFLKWIYYRLPTTLNQLRQSNADVVIKATPELATGMIALVCFWLRIPFVYRVANDIEADDRIKLRKEPYEIMAFKYALRTAKAIICQNSYQFTRFRELYPNKPVIILHNPYLNSLVNKNLQENRSYVAWVGIFQTQKNLPGLYEIATSLPNVKFKIAGDYFKALDQQSEFALEQLHRCKNVEFVGFLKPGDIPDFLVKAYLLLNTSHYEGFSNTFLEAFAVGTPVVTIRNVDPDEIIYKHGLGISVCQHADLKSAVENLIASPDYDTISKKCKDYINAHHDPVQLSQLYIEFLKINLGL